MKKIVFIVIVVSLILYFLFTNFLIEMAMIYAGVSLSAMIVLAILGGRKTSKILKEIDDSIKKEETEHGKFKHP